MRLLRDEKPDDEIGIVQLVGWVGLYPAIWCCQTLPEFDKQWRLYAVWCARLVPANQRLNYMKTNELHVNAINLAERFANGQVDEAERERACANLERLSATVSNQYYGGANLLAVAATLKKNAGLAAYEAASLSSIAVSYLAAEKAQYSIPKSTNELEVYANGNEAYAAAYNPAHKEVSERQKNEFISLLVKLSRK